jgi:transmembrane sensor
MNINFTEDIPWELLAKCISGNADVTEQKVLDSWIAYSSENKGLYQELQKLWSKDSVHSDQESDNEKLKKEIAWEKFKNKIDSYQKQKQSKYFKLKNYFLAASFAGIVILAYFVYSAFFSNVENLKMLSFANDKKEPMSLQLPDGSVVVLNKNSKINYPEKFQKRFVELEGEAYFKVVYQPNNRFTVSANEISVEVLGTAFNLKSYKDKNTKLLVESGKVLFKSKGNSLTLSAGQGAEFEKNTGKILAKTDINALAWKSNTFKFQNTTVSEIIETLESNFEIKIKINNKELLKCEFNGVFEKTQPELILQAMAFSLGLKINNENGFYVLEGEGCNSN